MGRPQPMDEFLSRGSALLQVIEEGFVDGDASRLRALIAEAETVDVRKRRGSSVQGHLDEMTGEVVPGGMGLLVR